MDPQLFFFFQKTLNLAWKMGLEETLAMTSTINNDTLQKEYQVY